MHDYWSALVVSLSGIICYVPMALILYRQHADNYLGQGHEDLGGHVGSIISRPVKKFREARKNFYVMQERAELLREKYSGMMTSEKQQEINEFLELFSRNKLSRLQAFLKLKPAHKKSLLYEWLYSKFRDFLFIVKLILY